MQMLSTGSNSFRFGDTAAYSSTTGEDVSVYSSNGVSGTNTRSTNTTSILQTASSAFDDGTTSTTSDSMSRSSQTQQHSYGDTTTYANGFSSSQCAGPR